MNRRIGKLLQELRHYPRLRDKLLSLYNVLLISRKLKDLPLPGRRKVIEIFVAGHAQPFAVRLGSTDWLVLVENFLDGEYSAIGQLLRQSSPATIIDIGANAGFSVRYWLERFPNARLVAIEPDPDNFAAMQRNVALAKPSVYPILMQACVVGQPCEHVYLERASGREWAFAISANESASTLVVKATTLGELMANPEIGGEIGLLKCDIEGSEVELFQHCDSWINRIKIAIVEVHGAFSNEDLVSMLKEKGVNVTAYPAQKRDLCIFTVGDAARG
jgi:FkbM family methyltransferase